jgi:hypothetical protein
MNCKECQKPLMEFRLHFQVIVTHAKQLTPDSGTIFTPDAGVFCSWDCIKHYGEEQVEGHSIS